MLVVVLRHLLHKVNEILGNSPVTGASGAATIAPKRNGTRMSTTT